MPAIKLALVGLGKIARDQHLPALAANPDYRVTALVSRSIHQQQPTAAFPEARRFSDLGQLLGSRLPIDAVSRCTPPQVRHAQAAQALAARLEGALAGGADGPVEVELDWLKSGEQREVAALGWWRPPDAARMASISGAAWFCLRRNLHPHGP